MKNEMHLVVSQLEARSVSDSNGLTYREGVVPWNRNLAIGQVRWSACALCLALVAAIRISDLHGGSLHVGTALNKAEGSRQNAEI